jgi:mono/diheme cytochrome c family protein
VRAFLRNGSVQEIFVKPIIQPLLSAFALFTAMGATHAQELGDPAAGLAYANGVCAECHAVKKGQRMSAHERAPAFEVVANTRGMTDMALRVWFQSPHPSMPNLMLTEKLSDDLVAYILSLKEPRRTGTVR